MNFRTLLLASAAVMVATGASAKSFTDFTNPFALPTKGNVYSETKVQTTRVTFDDGKEDVTGKEFYASEEVMLGVGENTALVGYIGNTFDSHTDDEDTLDLNNDHNFDYGFGVRYNHDFGKVLTQVGVMYRTMDEQSFFGQDHETENDRWTKGVEATVKVGYTTDCGLTPYTSFKVAGDIDSNNNEQRYSWFVGAHKMWEKTAVDFGVRYDFGKSVEDMYLPNDEAEGDGNNEAFYLQGSVDHYVTDNFTVGAYGEYFLGGDNDPVVSYKDIEHNYTVGLAAKVLF